MENIEKDTGIFLCNCKAGIISDEKLSAISESIRRTGVRVIELNDLCALSIDRVDLLRDLNRTFRRKIVIACYPRAVENILIQADAPFDQMTVLNFRNLSAEKIGTELGSFSGENSYETISSNLKVPAWFPVVEKTRCSNCGQCAGFCLFGVYNYTGKKLRVENPLSCKNNCPACARACPQKAIIFPGIKEDSSIAGAYPEEIQNQKQTGLLIDRLKQRSNISRNIFREDLLMEAEEERRRAIEETKKSKT